MEKNKIYHGNNLDIIKTFDDNSIDSIVTDPPYGISFMNKKWDYDVPTVEFWKEALRVLKPGGHALVACGTRTQHRMAVNLEDAGFEIRDIVAWVYGSGFPKSHDISKALDKMMGAEREIIGKAKGVGSNNTNSMKNGLGGSQEFASEYDLTKPSTEQAKQWQGWGTALKPAMELWTLCRKPLQGTVANNVLKYGVGGINIDGCRIATDDDLESNYNSVRKSDDEMGERGYKMGFRQGKDSIANATESTKLGRFPANVIHDGSDEVVKLFPNVDGAKSQNFNEFNMYGGNALNESKTTREGFKEMYDDSGSAARFFKNVEYTKEDLEWLNVNTVESSSNQEERLLNIVANLVQIEGLKEGFYLTLSNTIKPFMNEIRKQSRKNSVINMQQMKNTAEKSLQGLKHIITEMLNQNHVNYVEIQLLTNTMMTIQNLMNIDGFVEVVMSNIILNNMVHGEAGCLNRLYYTAKASQTERNWGLDGFEEKPVSINTPHNSKTLEQRYDMKAKNIHPTVKPIDLMRYLVRLVTPKNGICLDPYMGSGTTAIACKAEKINYVGCELDEEYIKIAEARIKAETVVYDIFDFMD